MCCAAKFGFDGDAFDLGGMFESVREKLAEHGIDFDACCRPGEEAGEGKSKVKVVCVAPDLQASAREMGESAREHVVMVRVDTATAEQLDAWVETGAVKSRSEAAALFIREGLKVRASELGRLAEALRKVREAKEQLHRAARDVFGGEEPDEGGS